VDSLREEVSAAESRADEERREAGSARAAAAAREAQLQAGLQEAAASVAALQRGLEVRSLQWSQCGLHIPLLLELTSAKAAANASGMRRTEGRATGQDWHHRPGSQAVSCTWVNLSGSSACLVTELVCRGQAQHKRCVSARPSSVLATCAGDLLCSGQPSCPWMYANLHTCLDIYTPYMNRNERSGWRRRRSGAAAPRQRRRPWPGTWPRRRSGFAGDHGLHLPNTPFSVPFPLVRPGPGVGTGPAAQVTGCFPFQGLYSRCTPPCSSTPFPFGKHNAWCASAADQARPLRGAPLTSAALEHGSMTMLTCLRLRIDAANT
jgi:hypothetical protein